MNASSTFQCLVSRVLIRYETFTAAYIDDILIFSQNESEHEQHLQRVLEYLACHNLHIQLKKYSFFQKQIPFLSHVLARGSVRIEPEKVEALQK